MKASEFAVKLAVTPAGAALDRYCVRVLDDSPVSRVFAWSEGVAYNRPLLLTARGRKTGEARTVVLPYFEAGPGRIAVVGSRGGMPQDPHWALNLRADREAVIHLKRRKQEIYARVAAGEERAMLWKQITERSPVYLTYQRRAHQYREIPVFVLERRDGEAIVTHAKR